jgi:NAD(P)-dependent dehydrogenase (short-subunit alcohol dehydrogenase family)
MMERGAGGITNVGSVTSTTGAIGGLAYTTSKHAVVGITRSIAWTYQGHGIRCNAVCPGAVETALDRTAVPRSSWGYDQLKRTHRLCPRVAGPDEVAALISWVSSEEATSLNGAVITADSGWTA